MRQRRRISPWTSNSQRIGSEPQTVDLEPFFYVAKMRVPMCKREMAFDAQGGYYLMNTQVTWQKNEVYGFRAESNRVRTFVICPHWESAPLSWGTSKFRLRWTQLRELTSHLRSVLSRSLSRRSTDNAKPARHTRPCASVLGRWRHIRSRASIEEECELVILLFKG